MNIKQFVTVLILGLILVIAHQNCGGSNLNSFLADSRCSGFLCDSNGIGAESALSATPADELIIPLIPGRQPRFKLNGNCSDGGFKRNRVVATLSENFVDVSNCENGERFVFSGKCEKGSFIVEGSIPQTATLCPLGQGLNLQLEMIGIDSFDNEYRPNTAITTGLVVSKPSIRPPVLNSWADGNPQDQWAKTRVVASSTEVATISDFVGFCIYSDNANQNTIKAHIKPVGVSDAYRLTFKDPVNRTLDMQIQCQQVTSNASAAIQNWAAQLGYNGFFVASSAAFQMPYKAQPQWPGLTGIRSQYNSRILSLMLSQTDPSISPTYRIENEQKLMIKFNSITTSQGWTLEILERAQKQIARLVHFSWDDSEIGDGDLNIIMQESGASYANGIRRWLVNRMQLIEDPITLKISSPDPNFNAFYDRIGKIAYGSKLCDAKLSGNMAQGITGNDYLNVPHNPAEIQEQRLALCMTYWMFHGMYDQNSIELVPNWKNTNLSKFITEGVRFDGPQSCFSAVTNTPADTPSWCEALRNYFSRIKLLKNRHLGSDPIYGGAGATYRNNQKLFNEAFAQFFINTVMQNVIVAYQNNPTTPTTTWNGFFDSVIRHSAPELYGTFENHLLAYPLEINMDKINGDKPALPFQAYPQTLQMGSTDARGSEGP